MVKVEIDDRIATIVQKFIDVNNKYLLVFLWGLVSITMIIVVYGATVEDYNIFLQAIMLFPITTFVLFGTKAILFNINPRFKALDFANGALSLAIWLAAFGTLNTIIPVVGYQTELNLEENGLIDRDTEPDIYSFFRSYIFEIYMIYLPIVYIIRFIGVQLKNHGTGSTD